MENYPIYKAVVNMEDDTAMFAVSLVDEPAVQKDFLAFSEEKEVIKFAIENEEQRLVTGLVMSCDTPIIRISPSGKPYYIVFEKDTLKVMARKFLKNGYNNNVDLQHDFNYVDGVELLELYMKDTERGINPKGFEEVKNGSLFGTYYVSDDAVWNDIKSGKFKGFSIEIVCETEPVEEDQDFKEIEQLIEEIKNKIRK